MEAGEGDIGKMGPRLRYKVARTLGFACPDIDDIVQETLKRYLESVKADRIHSPEAAGAFLNGICRNVISEYRRRLFRDVPMPEIVPEPPARGIPEPELFELRNEIGEGMRQLAPRDREVLRLFYLEEMPIPQILEKTGLTEANFRVVLCRAKGRFRQIYLDACNKSKATATT
jgi:RNA polymerase sigma-70 factor (ECF subfamily)